MNKFLLYTLLSTICFQGLSQDILTKTQALEMALEKNFSIKIANNEAEVARLNTDKRNHDFLPEVSASAGAYYNVDNSTAFFQSGTETSINLASSNSANASVSVDYTLFDGFNRQYSLEQSLETYTNSQLNAKLNLQNLIAELFGAYYETARVSADFKNLNEILAVSEERLERTKTNYEYGKGSLLDVSNAEVDVNTDQIALLNQKQLLEAAKNNLNYTLNNNFDNSFSVDTTVSFNKLLLKEAFIESLKTDNIQVQMAKSAIRISELDQKLVVTSKLPKVSLGGDYGYNYSKNNPVSFLSKSNSNGLTANITASWSIFDGGSRKIQEQNAKIATLNSQLNLDQLNLQIRRDFENAWSNYQNKLQVWKSLEQNVITNKLNFERSEEKFKLGQVSSTDFRLAQSNLLNAQTSKNRAKFEAKIAELNVYAISGKVQEFQF